MRRLSDWRHQRGSPFPDRSFLHGKGKRKNGLYQGNESLRFCGLSTIQLWDCSLFNHLLWHTPQTPTRVSEIRGWVLGTIFVEIRVSSPAGISPGDLDRKTNTLEQCDIPCLSLPLRQRGSRSDTEPGVWEMFFSWGHFVHSSHLRTTPWDKAISLTGNKKVFPWREAHHNVGMWGPTLPRYNNRCPCEWPLSPSKATVHSELEMPSISSCLWKLDPVEAFKCCRILNELGQAGGNGSLGDSPTSASLMGPSCFLISIIQQGFLGCIPIDPVPSATVMDQIPWAINLNKALPAQVSSHWVFHHSDETANMDGKGCHLVLLWSHTVGTQSRDSS